jgi:hypothetical protein
MVEVIHLRCDKCGKDVAYDSNVPVRKWARCRVDFDIFDFCPGCWAQIMAAAQVEEPA